MRVFAASIIVVVVVGCGRIEYRLADGSFLPVLDGAEPGTGLDGASRDGASSERDAPGSDGASHDASLPEDAAVATCAAWGPFATPVHLDAVSSSLSEWGPAISPDELRLYFCSGEAGATLSVASRLARSQPFGAPSAVPGIPTDIECNPALTDDELEIVFDLGGDGLLRIARRGAIGLPFGTAEPIPLPTSGVTRMGADLAGDLVLYHTVYDGDSRIAIATRSDRSSDFVLEDFVTELDSSGQDGYPTLSSDGLEIFFGSTRIGGSALIHRATRASVAAPFDPPAPVPELMPPAGGQTGDPELSADGRTIYFARDAPGEPGAGDLWSATRECMR